ncbi:hypothetical protein ACOZWC_002328 [Cronobacter turicensis]|nr:hypothetical protein [Cronobacter turicensis]
MFKKIYSGLKEVNTASTIGEKLLRVIAYFIVFFGGSTTTLFAWMDPVLKDSGPFVYASIFLITSLAISLVFFFLKFASYLSSRKKYYDALSERKSSLNPLSNNFDDLVIHLEDLRLPNSEPQQDKTFRRCRIVGPLTVFVNGGVFERCNFNNSGDILALPLLVDKPLHFTGVLGFFRCNFFDCTFIDVTVLTTYDFGGNLQRENNGFSVVFLDEHK